MYMLNGKKLSMVQGDITTLTVDAIVNAANSTLLGGGGVDGAIHRAGGPAILKECKAIGGCPAGEARITTAGTLPCKKVIHTVGPIYKDGQHNEPQLLYSAYDHSLKLAEEYGLKTIAFPAISTGVYGYPKDQAADIAIQAVADFIKTSDSIEEVIFVLFSGEDYEIYREKLNILLKSNR